MDQLYLKFGEAFEQKFIAQRFEEDRAMEETLDLGWRLLSLLPKSELDRVDNDMLEAHYLSLIHI